MARLIAGYLPNLSEVNFGAGVSSQIFDDTLFLSFSTLFFSLFNFVRPSEKSISQHGFKVLLCFFIKRQACIIFVETQVQILENCCSLNWYVFFILFY